MLDYIVSWFNTIWDVIQSLVSIVLSFLQMTWNLVKMLPNIISIQVSVMSFLPSMVSLFAILSVTVSVIFLVLGRNNN